MKKGNKTTKFPVARIKKIMQKDEEVGKVAQATPVVISKALELFLQMVVDEASKVTVSRGSRKVEAYHLKHAIETTEMLDFLKEIVANVPDPSAGGTLNLDGDDGAPKAKRGRKKAQSTASAPAVEGEGGEPAPKKRRRRKAKTEAAVKEDVQDEDEEMGEAGSSRRAAPESWDEDDDE